MASIGVAVLGPLRLVVDGRPVEVRGPKRRAVLATLALAQGGAVTVSHLLEALWPVELPESGRAALHSHVSRLRGQLGATANRLETLDGGYRLTLRDGELDVAEARAVLAGARAGSAEDPDGACRSLRGALGLWRGVALAEFAEFPPLATAAVSVAELRRELVDLLITCSIERGRSGEVAALAAESLAEDPLREPAVRLVMRTLAATGRAPEALRAGREYRRRLAVEAGLDPSPELAELERAVAGGIVGPPRTPLDPTPPATRPGPARPATPLIGRDAQLAALRRLLAAERLVTVTGPGGVGKTRLALAAARDLDDGDPATLPLAPLTDPAAIAHALAAALNLRVVQGDVLAACVALLATGPRLLVLDNCEHLLDAVRDTVTVLLDGCPELTVLATSREPLGLAAECASRLAPLALPAPDDGPERLAEVPAVAMFLDRARRVRTGLTVGPAQLRLVAEIVRGLDGMPLAIELAAGRLSGFTLPDLAARLDRSLDLLGGGRASADARHRTLRTTVEWSYRLLPADERRLFRHLSVFADGVDLAAAERVAAEVGITSDPAGALAHLVDASMVEVSFDGETARYRMLATLRAFGLDQLVAEGETATAEDRLVRWAVELAAWIDSTSDTEREPDADTALRRELANLRTAWRLARRRGRLDEATALVIALHEVTSWRDLPELRAWADELVELPALVGCPRAAVVLAVAAEAAYLRGDYARAERLAHTGLGSAPDAAGRSACLGALGLAALSRQEFEEAIRYKAGASTLATRPDGGLGVAALAATYAGDPTRGRELNRREADGAVAPTLRAFVAYVDGEIDNAEGLQDRAERHYRRAIELARSSGATFVVGIASVGLLSVLAAEGRVRDALLGYREVIDYFARSGNWTQLWVTLRNLATLLRRLGDHQPADLLDTAADQAPDAPPAANPGPHHRPPVSTVGRDHALDTARRSIERHLGRASARAPHTAV